MDQPPRPNRQPPANLFYILDDNGTPRPVGLNEWMRWVETNPGRREIGDTQVGRYHVRTFFMGVGSLGGPGWSGLFETVVNDREWRTTARPEWRYDTLRSARAGHRRAVRWARIRRLWHWW